MNSFIQYIPESLNDNKAFVEHILSIIDTKLQFIKHSTNVLLSSYVASPVLEENQDTPLPADFSLDLGDELIESEKIFILIETYSKTTNLLLLLRIKLNTNNVSLIYDLLNNDRFLTYENEELERLLEGSLF